MGSEARHKERRRVGDSQRGRWAPGQMTSRAQDPEAHRAQQRMPSPTKSSHQHKALCPSLLIPSLGGWELGAPQGEGLSLLSASLPSQAARQLSPHRPGLAWPSLPRTLARPRHCRLPGLGQGIQTEGLSSSYLH